MSISQNTFPYHESSNKFKAPEVMDLLDRDTLEASGKVL